ncbi:2-(5''-triphosphoribosyl)-3'-dephosphocoenzyme-A synthase (plasmid) [Caballeronia sp. SBC1]|jgi:triphosphoribosyl-dephospho-CoA synthase|uniref:triphosphoribosyl-dephospho-CoA synthase MdcB n=1 Tax=unclassified Caballeronia TaxID=2646786 RepID=UPI0013E1827C|nr:MULTISPECIES: triphosphoribosyl-dephospho-CoA synthase MdcB [unclassified Caballeronia]QIE25909.1 2-(5''-triphosphoribosyl)-3'-dephosphocoenzyme-A synthase [Caballeronia sp. SBC2]QIN64778.1 2-(5''-triphosphoribosyl)-3'-dephosphocoenzyme-A synthase [Caballeronia sp. SBC1]
MSTLCSPVDNGSVAIAEAVASYAEHCLRLELETWPKPGLVSLVDSGSHDDMDACTFARSAAAIRPYFAELARAGAARADMAVLRRIGVRAEHAMFAATGGVNTHRGAIFGLGLLCAAAGRRSADSTLAESARMPTLGEIISRHWGDDILVGPRPLSSHGEVVGRRYGVGGARYEAANGFASVYRFGVPSLREAEVLRPGDAAAARVHACFALIAALDDTNLLHRGGETGLAFAQQTARDFIACGGVGSADWLARAEAAHREFVSRRLSPGGAADLLAMSLFVAAFDRDT